MGVAERSSAHRPAYTERRSTMAKALGFGRKPEAQATPEMSPPTAPTPVDVDLVSKAKPARRRSRAASKSADVTSEAVAAPSPARSRRSRSASKPLAANSGNEAVAEPKSASKRRPVLGLPRHSQSKLPRRPQSPDREPSFGSGRAVLRVPGDVHWRHGRGTRPSNCKPTVGVRGGNLLRAKS